MSVKIRRARAEDATAIADICENSFEEIPDRNRLRRLLVNESNVTFVATDGLSALGFADNFISRSQQGNQRMELDLMAVCAWARGRGVGKQLFCASIALTTRLALSSIRALVKVDNLAMQTLCESMGWSRSLDRFILFVRSPAPSNVSAPTDHPGHPVRVDTLTYDGVWIEGGLSQNTVDAAMIVAMNERRTVVGAAVRENNGSARRVLLNNAFEMADAYHWWELNLKGA